LALLTGVSSFVRAEIPAEVVLEDVVRIQVPRGLILHHLSRPAGASPPGFHALRRARIFS
jgi:hypothetical protein